MSEPTLKQILFTADGITDKPIPTASDAHDADIRAAAIAETLRAAAAWQRCSIHGDGVSFHCMECMRTEDRRKAILALTEPAIAASEKQRTARIRLEEAEEIKTIVEAVRDSEWPNNQPDFQDPDYQRKEAFRSAYDYIVKCRLNPRIAQLRAEAGVQP